MCYTHTNSTFNGRYMPQASYVTNTVSATQNTFWNLLFNLCGIPQKVSFRYNAQNDKLDFMTTIQTRLEPFGVVAQSVQLPQYGGGRTGSYQGGYKISNQEDFLTVLRTQALGRDILDPMRGVTVQVIMDELKMKRNQTGTLSVADSGYASNASTNGD